MKIGIFGGSFDPIHIEHINLARKAIESLSLDKLFIVPALSPPHKPWKTLAPACHRLAMCKLAFEDVSKVDVSDYELSRGGTSFTYLTCEYFKNEYKDAQLFFLVGTDMLRDFPTWKNTENILENATLAVCARAEEQGWIEKEQAKFKAQFDKEFAVIEYNARDISATEIRILAGAGMDITALTDERVAKYIKDNKLYEIQGAKTALSLLTKERLAHTLRVTRLAVKRAVGLCLPEKKVITAALFHDCAKYVKIGDKLLEGFIPPNDNGEIPNSVMHQYTGAYIAKRLGVTDEETVNAIAYHTTGREGMTLLEKLIFLADMLEESRAFTGVEKLRELFWEDDKNVPLENRLDKCLALALTMTVEHLTESGNEVYPLTIRAKEYYQSNKE